MNSSLERIRSGSISFRITLWFSAVFLLGLIVFGVVMFLDLGLSLRTGRERTLKHRAERLVDLLRSSAALAPDERARKFVEFEQATPEGSLIQAFRGSKRIYPVTSTVNFPWPVTRADGDTAFIRRHYQGQPYLVLMQREFVNGDQLRIFVGGQLSDNEQLLRRFLNGLLATIPALLILSAFGGYFLSRRALQPVDRLTDSARAISIHNLSGRLPVANTGDEFQKLAETCNDMLSRLEAAVTQLKRFTADASHELRSPISFIRTVAECALLNPEIDKESQSALREIIDESDQAGRLLEDMLTLARSDAGGLALASEQVDLVDVVEESYSRVLTFAESRAQSVTISLPVESSIEIHGDRSTLRQLLKILLENAIKYTPTGGKIKVDLQSNGPLAILSVSDTGIGIPLASLPHVFERFYRVDPSRSEVSGTGLGLAIAKWIAERHGAQISVSSVEGAGSTFQVEFPAVPHSLSRT